MSDATFDCPTPGPSPSPPPPNGGPAITTSRFLPPTVVGGSYTQQFQATGGAPPYAWSIAGGSTPGGTTMTSWGLFGGIPTSSGTYSFLVRVADAQNRSASDWFTLMVGTSTPPPTGSPVITSGNVLPQGVMGSYYDFVFQATGGTLPYSWRIVSGSMPGSMTFFGNNGELTGVPNTFGTFNLRMRVTDSSAKFSEKDFVWTVVSPHPTPTPTPTPVPTPTPTPPPGGALVITTGDPLPTRLVGESYNITLHASGGTPPYHWGALLNGGFDPPPNFSLSGDGRMNGTPLSAGYYSFVAQVSDESAPARFADKIFYITIEGPGPTPTPTPTPPPSGNLTITTSNPLPNGMVGNEYGKTFQASGGTPAYVWSLDGGSLPLGMAFSQSGQLSGRPSQSGSYSFTIGVRDSQNRTGNKGFDLRIDPAPTPTPTPTPVPTPTPTPPPQCNPNMSPTFVSPANNATVSGTIQVKCTVPNNSQACPGSYMEYVACGPNSNCPPWTYHLGSGPVPFSVNWNTANVPKGGQPIFCIFHTTQFENSAMVWVTVQ